MTERKQVSFQPPTPGSEHREPWRGLQGAGVWVRTPQDPSCDCHGGGGSAFSIRGTRKKTSEMQAHFPMITSCLKNKHTNTCFSDLRKQSSQVLALGTPKRCSGSPLGARTDMWGVGVLLHILSEGGIDCKTATSPARSGRLFWVPKGEGE